MKNMKQLITTLFACLLSLSLNAQTENSFNFELELQKSVESMTSIESDFTQIKHLDMFDEDVESKGKFAYKKEGKIYMNYLSPTDYTVIINNQKLKIVAGKAKTIMQLGENKAMNGLQDMITACMVGDLSRLKANYNIQVDDNLKNYTINIVPKSQSIREFINKIVIKLNKIDMSVDELIMFENENDYTKYIFTNKRFNQLTDETIFSVD